MQYHTSYLLDITAIILDHFIINVLWIYSIQHLQNSLTIPFGFSYKFSPIISSDWGIYHNEGWILSKTNSYLFTVSSSQSANTHQVEWWYNRINHSCLSLWFVQNPTIKYHQLLHNSSTPSSVSFTNLSALSLHFWNILVTYLQPDTIKWTRYLIKILSLKYSVCFQFRIS